MSSRHDQSVMRGFAVAVTAAVVTTAAVAAAPPRRDGPIAFQRDGELGSTDIWLVGAAGGGERNLTPDTANDFQPSWSPDGRRIAFASDRGGEFLSPPAIHLMNDDGTGIRKLVAAGSEQTAPAWSPDGRLIAFSVCISRNELDVCTAARIAVATPAGRSFRYVTRTAGSVIDSKPAWSPNSQFLAFTRTVDDGYNVVWIVRADGKALRRLVDDRSQVDHNPSWSPDGKSVVYISDASDADAVWTVAATGKGRRLLFAATGDPTDEDAAAEGVANPAFSPSGRRIVFTRGGEIWTMAVTGGDLRQLTDGGGDESDWGRAH